MTKRVAVLLVAFCAVMTGAMLSGQAVSQAPAAVPNSAQTAVPAQTGAKGSQERSLLMPPSDVYRLQPGDSITVNFRFTPEFNDEVVIGPDGRAMLKSTGVIRLAGYTLAEAQHEIIRQASSSLVNPEVTINLKDFDRPHVVVAGDVGTPGRYDLRKPTTALQAILMAGGPKSDAAMGRVLLFRKLNSETAEVHVLQLGDFKGKKPLKNDIMLQPDDMILVRNDKLSKIERYVKVANLGVYFDPLNSSLF